MSVDSPLGGEFADTYRDRSVPATPGAINVDDAEPLGTIAAADELGYYDPIRIRVRDCRRGGVDDRVMTKSRVTVLMANPRGFCAGVERAIQIVETALDKFGAPVYVRHEIVHNRHVVEGLEGKGAVFVDCLDEVPDGARVIFSAHGVSNTVFREAERRHLPFIDATCPLVTKVHREAQRHHAAGREGGSHWSRRPSRSCGHNGSVASWGDLVGRKCDPGRGRGAKATRRTCVRYANHPLSRRHGCYREHS